LPPRSLHPCVRARRAARRPGSRTRRRRRRRFTARRHPHLHTRPAPVTGRGPDHDTTCAPSPTLGQQQSGATATTGTHRRDARSAPGSMARRDAGTRSLLPTCTRWHGTKASTHILLPSRSRRESRTFLPAPHGDGSAQEHRRLRDSLRRGAAHLQLHGHLPGTVPRRRASTSRQHRQSQGGEKRKVRWCSRGVDGVVVAGLLESWRRCSGDADVPQWRRCSRRR
jgi:hypothetical protein